MAKALGVGGVFFRADDPRALAEWYARWLGFELQFERGAVFGPAQVPPGGFTVWGAFERDSDYFQTSQSYMINLMVDDVAAALGQVREGGATVTQGVSEHENGLFGWFVDPEGNQVELWQPRPETS